MGPAINQLDQRRQAVENAKAQLASITARTQLTTECIGVLLEAGREIVDQGGIVIPAPHPLLAALCKVQLAQLQMAEQEGLAAIQDLGNFIKTNDSPLFGATLIPPKGARH